ncbi:MAG TPA: DmsC/YnfH family molybdoenzyme membrane anchor subunit, partial [Acidimicrobiales bacterium]|nr:DmsC/YnfH family molybdoenzyme membrane anchor subunit [Acidimicrobiales bacterium]
MTAVAPRRDLHGITPDGPELLPLDAGEQYRFSFEMDACIGCHSCEVACAEQNGNPVGVDWRRVGEVEGGTFPNTRRFSISMACNQCLEPACLQGCPTNAYVKLANGVVQHHADDCIGCQYCMWNCPYDVPVFNATRRVVTKCDMCQPRLEAGRAPACVQACPTHAIKVEKVDVAQWRADHAAADAPGLPPSGLTISTTRIIPPKNLPLPATVAGQDRVEPEHPHLPLVALTVLSQIAVGAVSATVVLESLVAILGARSEVGDALGRGALAAFLLGACALGASLLHLGRPAVAWKALRNLRTSWLSREVALLGAFVAAALGYALARALQLPGLLPGVIAVLLGGAGVFASGRLYLIPARPMWNSPRTIVGFFATALALGPLVTLLAVGAPTLPQTWARAVLLIAVAGAALQLATWRHLMRTASRHGAREYHVAARLLWGRFRTLVVARILLGGVGAVAVLIALTAT